MYKGEPRGAELPVEPDRELEAAAAATSEVRVMAQVG